MQRLETQTLRRAGVPVDEVARHAEVSPRTVQRFAKEVPVREVRFGKLPKDAAPILTARAKFAAEYQERAGIESAPADIDDETTRRIGRLAKRVYRALELPGAARIDLRLHDDGRVFVIEADPDPDLCAFEDLATSAESADILHQALIHGIVEPDIAHRSAWRIR